MVVTIDSNSDKNTSTLLVRDIRLESVNSSPIPPPKLGLLQFGPRGVMIPRVDQQLAIFEQGGIPAQHHLRPLRIRKPGMVRPDALLEELVGFESDPSLNIGHDQRDADVKRRVV